jgi:hypothetical protein
LWDALEAKYSFPNAGNELYVMEQAHEIQSLAKELEGFKCELPSKYVARSIIAKLPPSWRDFATSLKHKRQVFSIADLIGSLDVEEKARVKDTHGKSVVGSTSANLVQKNNSNAFHNSKKKNKMDKSAKAKQTTAFKKKKEKGKGKCCTCGLEGHYAKECKDIKYKPKSANMVISETVEHRGTIIIYL